MDSGTRVNEGDVLPELPFAPWLRHTALKAETLGGGWHSSPAGG